MADVTPSLGVLLPATEQSLQALPTPKLASTDEPSPVLDEAATKKMAQLLADTDLREMCAPPPAPTHTPPQGLTCACAPLQPLQGCPRARGRALPGRHACGLGGTQACGEVSSTLSGPHQSRVPGFDLARGRPERGGPLWGTLALVPRRRPAPQRGRHGGHQLRGWRPGEEGAAKARSPPEEQGTQGDQRAERVGVEGDGRAQRLGRAGCRPARPQQSWEQLGQARASQDSEERPGFWHRNL